MERPCGVQSSVAALGTLLVGTNEKKKKKDASVPQHAISEQAAIIPE